MKEILKIIVLFLAIISTIIASFITMFTNDAESGLSGWNALVAIFLWLYVIIDGTVDIDKNKGDN